MTQPTAGPAAAGPAQGAHPHGFFLRHEQEWPLARTDRIWLYLDLDTNGLAEQPPTGQQRAEFTAARKG
jgi:uncharacterized protein